MTRGERIGPLFTDLYELTMAASYYEHHASASAVFSLFIRGNLPQRGYFVSAGLEDVLNELEDFHFSESEITYLKETGLFSDEFLLYLGNLRFSGQIYAIPEGTIFFANEPILEVQAPIIEAQIIETFLLNTIGFQTLIASKAARCIYAADGRPLIDFSLRRTQGKDAGMKVARSTYIAGFAGTSNVLAGKIYNIPISGTMAHSYVTAFNSEFDAFSAYSRAFPKTSIFLVDTYDTLEGTKNAIRIAEKMKEQGEPLVGVRLDSGDMVDLSLKVRKILDAAGFSGVKIFASSGFDEYKITDAIYKGAKIDAFGVGTKLGVSADQPYFDIVYKLTKFKDRDIRKLSTGKVTLAGKKQVFRKSDAADRYQEDIIGLRDERIENSTLLLEKVMEDGKMLQPNPSLQMIRERFSHNFSCLEDEYKVLEVNTPYPVKLSRCLVELQENL